MTIALRNFRLGGLVLVVSITLLAGNLSSAPPGKKGASPTAAEALKLTPTQKDVDYDRPADVSKCTIKSENLGGARSWVVRDAAGQILRNFSDTNGDDVVDQWSYYKDGLEVYRDVDSNFDGKADQYRWLNTAGTRWGTDPNQDGIIDAWKMISAEEVTAEAVAAVRDRNVARFERLLLTPKELKSLRLGEDKAKQLAAKLDTVSDRFRELIKNQKTVTPTTHWAYFGGSRPGLVPIGTAGSKADLTVYENVVVMLETGDKSGQLPIGTLVRVQDNWRLIDAPIEVSDNVADSALRGFFIEAPAAKPEQAAASVPGGPNKEEQKLMAQLDQLEKEGTKELSDDEQAKLNAKRVEILKKLVKAAETVEGQAQWTRQLVDTLSAAVQTSAYPEGLAQLKEQVSLLQDKPEEAELAAHAKFLLMTAEYTQSLQKDGANFPEIQTQWLKDLETFVKSSPKGPDLAEAMLQLANAQEFNGAEDKAIKWYNEIIRTFDDTATAKRKAIGAKLRLESIGKAIALQGKKLGGGTIDLASPAYRGKVVLLHYWAAEYDACHADFPQLKEMLEKYGRDGFAVIGISLDMNQSTLESFLQGTRVPWPQIYEPGGLDSRLGNDLGILTLPTMILVDKQGKVINRNVHATDLESELKSQLKPQMAEKSKKSSEQPTNK